MQEGFNLILGDCLSAMRDMQDKSVDALVADPPYGLQIAGERWDTFGSPSGNESLETRKQKGRDYAKSHKGAPRYHNSHGHSARLDEMREFQERMTPIFAEALRVCKPGSHALVFGGTRTFHRMACAMEEAGWQLIDCVSWNYAQGMPHGQRVDRLMSKVAPDEAGKWAGYNTALKPAWEPIILARRPLEGTIANNVLNYGVGAMNIDACRIPSEPHDSSREGEASKDRRYDTVVKSGFTPGPRGGDERGRYPANLAHDGSDEVRALFPDSGGQQGDLRGGIPKKGSVVYGEYGPTKEYPRRDELDKSAVRFFFCAKASKRDRAEYNDGPCVKPTELMRWLVRLITPSGGVVLDPFMGTGSTGKACVMEGMRFIGIEQDPHYFEIAARRIEDAERQG